MGSECTGDCVFAPHFPPDEPARFAAYVDHVFGIANLSNLLNGIDLSKRDDAVDNLVYDAQARRIRDSVHGIDPSLYALFEMMGHLEHRHSMNKRKFSSYNPQAAAPAGNNSMKLPPSFARGRRSRL
ncbi:LOB domain-containing protein 36 [Acorus gramineus]|uniref:LOB domain-containing protein 36 n=1 Tax=Acorus gramineus TaxID=55184 RepID=A0AAV9AZX6_ACOGR|nr:LOB domain-containing protein 36 [Acorus gramineus]